MRKPLIEKNDLKGSEEKEPKEKGISKEKQEIKKIKESHMNNFP